MDPNAWFWTTELPSYQLSMIDDLEFVYTSHSVLWLCEGPWLTNCHDRLIFLPTEMPRITRFVGKRNATFATFCLQPNYRSRHVLKIETRTVPFFGVPKFENDT